MTTEQNRRRYQTEQDNRRYQTEQDNRRYQSPEQDNRRYQSPEQDNRRYRSQEDHSTNQHSQSPNFDQTMDPDVDQTINQQPKVSINPQVEQTVGPQVEQNMNPTFEQHINVSVQSENGSSAAQNNYHLQHSGHTARRRSRQAERPRTEPSRKRSNQQAGSTHSYADNEVDLVRISRIIWALVVGLESLIALRIFLKLIGVNPDSGFATFIYGITEVFLLPFSALTGTPAANGSVLEISSFIAMIAYAVLGGIVVRFMRAAS